MNIKEMRETRGILATRIRELAELANEEGRDFSAEEQGNWETLNEDYNRNTRAIEREERAAEVAADQTASYEQRIGHGDTTGAPIEHATGEVTAEDQGRALGAWMRCQSTKESRPEDLEACRRAGVNHLSPEFSFQLASGPELRGIEQRAQGIASGSIGGFTVAEDFSYRLETSLLQYGGPRMVADVIRTETGAPMDWPSYNDTGNTGELLAENTAATEQDLVFANTVLAPVKFSSKLIKVAQELVTDSSFNVSDELARALGERLGRIQSTFFTTGTGTSQPQGVVTASVKTVTAAGATILDTEVIDLLYALDPAYRKRDAVWMCNDSILSLIRRLQDSEGRFIWAQGLGEQPDSILGHRIITNSDMGTTFGSGDVSMLFGDFWYYKVRDVKEMRIRHLTERFADADQDAWVGFMRSDGRQVGGVGSIQALSHP